MNIRRIASRRRTLQDILESFFKFWSGGSLQARAESGVDAARVCPKDGGEIVLAGRPESDSGLKVSLRTNPS